MTAVEALLQQGAEPNAKDNAGWTPLVRFARASSPVPIPSSYAA